MNKKKMVVLVIGSTLHSSEQALLEVLSKENDNIIIRNPEELKDHIKSDSTVFENPKKTIVIRSADIIRSAEPERIFMCDNKPFPSPHKSSRKFKKY